MTGSKVPESTGSTGSTGHTGSTGPTGDAPGGGGWATVLPAVVLLLRAGVTDGQLSHLTDLRVRVQRGAFATDGGPERGPERAPRRRPVRTGGLPPDADAPVAGPPVT